MTKYEPVFFDIETTGLNPLAQEWHGEVNHDAQVLCIAIGTLVDWREGDSGHKKNIEVLSGDSEYSLLEQLRNRADNIITRIESGVDGVAVNDDEHRSVFLVGYNSRQFDHPYLGARYARYRQDSWPFGYGVKRLDMMRAFDDWGSQDDKAKENGIEVTDEIDGSDIPDLYKRGEWDKIEHHAREDLDVLMDLFVEVKDDAMAQFYQHYDIDQDLPMFNDSVDL